MQENAILFFFLVTTNTSEFFLCNDVITTHQMAAITVQNSV